MKIKGDDIIVFFKVGGAWKALAYGLSCEIDIAAEVMTVCSPMTGRWIKTKKRRLSWTGSSAHLLSDTVDAVDVKRLVREDTPVKILMGSVEAHREKMDAGMYVPDGRFFFAGEAQVTRCTITANRGTSSTMSMEFQGTGEPDWRTYEEVVMTGEKLLHEEDGKTYNVGG